jgi:hypothetical protein
MRFIDKAPEALRGIPVTRAFSRMTILDRARPSNLRGPQLVKKFRIEQSLESGEMQRKQKKKSLEKAPTCKARNKFESLLDEEEDDARLIALDLDSPGTSSAVSCADLITAVKKAKAAEARKQNTMTPCKFAEAVLKPLDGALITRKLVY